MFPLRFSGFLYEKPPNGNIMRNANGGENENEPADLQFDLGGGAMTLATDVWPKGETPANPRMEDAQSPPAKWPEGAYRRLLVDTHVPDWDPQLLANFDAAEYVRTIAEAGFTSVMQYAKSHVGLCLWPSQVGPVHANMKGRDYFGGVMKECRQRGLHTVAYYSLIFDIWAFDHFPDWRILPENGTDTAERAPGRGLPQFSLPRSCPSRIAGIGGQL